MKASPATHRYLCITTYARPRKEAASDLYALDEPVTPADALRTFLLRQDLLLLRDIVSRPLRRDLNGGFRRTLSARELRAQSRIARRWLVRMTDAQIVRAAARFGVTEIQLIDHARWQVLWWLSPPAEAAAQARQARLRRCLRQVDELTIAHAADTAEQIAQYGQVLWDRLYLLDGDDAYPLFDLSLPAPDPAGAPPCPDFPVADDDPEADAGADPGCPAPPPEPEPEPCPWLPDTPITSIDAYPDIVRRWLRIFHPCAAEKPICLIDAPDGEGWISPPLREALERLRQIRPPRRICPPLRLKRRSMRLGDLRGRRPESG